MSIAGNWYEDFFQGLALDLWRQAISPRQTKAEADFLVRTLKCDPGAHLLDVPCGNGRLSFELARRGYRVTGIDISEEFIAEARALIPKDHKDQPPATAGGPDSAKRVEFLLGDMRRIEGEALYDGAFCFGNSFGFLEYADMERFLSCVARTLPPHGRFVVETGMAAESVLPDFEEQTSHEIGDMNVIIKERYVAADSCIDSEYIFERNGRRESRKAKHWIYTAAEIRRMLERAGFVVLNSYGSLKCEPYKLGCQELFVVAETSTGPLAIASR
jgi:cyclopropane fatty-acyl-phospholipid synthase-like methyltransferase